MTQGERLKLTRDFSKKVSDRLRSNPINTKTITDDISSHPTTVDTDEKIVISDSDENEMDETLDENSEVHEDSFTFENDDENDNMEEASNERQE